MNNTIAALVLALIVSPVGAWAADGPSRGMNKAQVRQQFGEPQRVQAPVGNPPIGRWHYPGFTVYFENNIVLHSVSEERPTRPAAATETAEPVASEPAAEQPSSDAQPAANEQPASEPTTIREREEGHPLPPDVENQETQIEVKSRIKNRNADSDDKRRKKSNDDDETDESNTAPGSTGVRAAGEGEQEVEEDAEPQDQSTGRDPDKAADRFRFDPVSGRIVIDDEPATEDSGDDQPLTRGNDE